MNRINVILLMLVVFGVFGCASFTEENRYKVATDINGLEYIDAMARYVERPTFAEVIEYQSGELILSFDINTYSVYKKPIIYIRKNQIDDHIEAIDKYFEWAKIATEAGDLLDKEITYIPKVHPGVGTLGNKITFHSGSKGSHYISIMACYDQILITDNCYGSLTLSEHGALKLKRLLKKFAIDGIKYTDTSKYN